jgi:dipeptidase
MSSFRQKNIMVRSGIIVTVLYLLILCDPLRVFSCTVLIAGKKVTVDGSILFAKTEDDSPRSIDYLWFIPRRFHPDDAVLRLVNGAELPQVKMTYAYFWDQCPGTSFSNMVVNEWGVAFGSNGCASKEDSIEAVQERGDLKNGGIGFYLRFILAQRAKTAREAVEIAAELLDEYGYSASGRNLNIVGPNEAWQLQMARGKQYVARKVQDGEVVFIANTFSIREVDPEDTENFNCSPELIRYAKERGWYDPEQDGEFDFAAAYAPERVHRSPSNTRRQWILAKSVNEHFPLTLEQAENGKMPVSTVPERKLSAFDIMNIFRNHFEGTKLDRSNGYKRSPHKTDERTICCFGTHRTTLVEQRSWLPPEVGTVIWRALGMPCSSGFVPWYLGARTIPAAYQRAPIAFKKDAMTLSEYNFTMPEEIKAMDPESASCVFGLLSGLVDADYQVLHGSVKSRWGQFEEKALRMRNELDQKVMSLFENDKELAVMFLDQFTSAMAQEALNVAQDMKNKILWNIWGSGLGKDFKFR